MADLDHDRTIQAGTLLANTYRVGELIGRGGMGEVYEAYHARTGATFAVKVLLSDFSSDKTIWARFKREAEVSSRLQHPNIVRVFDFDDTPDGRPFLAMERLRGRELASFVAPGQPMSLREVVRIFGQLTSALRAAHEAGVVHRDLKPSNIFIEDISPQDQGVVKVLDFGISKVRDSATNATQASHILGTPHYMSPEQALGRKEIDQRSDIFALGAIAYELLTGRRAFGPEDPNAVEPLMNVLFRVVHVEPAPFAAWGIALPRVENVVMRAMAKDPSLRHADAASLGLAFREAAEGVKATSPSVATGPGGRRPLAGATQALPASTLSGATGEELRYLRARQRPFEPPTERTPGRRPTRTMWLLAALAIGTAGLTVLGIDLVRTPSRSHPAPSRPDLSATPGPSSPMPPVHSNPESKAVAPPPPDEATMVVPPSAPPVAARPNDTGPTARRAHSPTPERVSSRDKPSHGRKEKEKEGSGAQPARQKKNPEAASGASGDATVIRNEDI